MDAVVVLATGDAAEERLLLVRFIVAIHISKDLHLVGGGNDHLGVFTIHRAQHADSVRGINVAALIKDLLGICLPIAVSILQNQNPVALLTFVAMAAVIDDLGHPHAAPVINIDIGRAEHHRLGGKHLGLQCLMHIQILHGILGIPTSRRGIADRRRHGRKTRLLCEDVELCARDIATGTLTGSTIVQPHTGDNLHIRMLLGQTIGNDRVGVRADAEFHQVAVHAQRFATAVLVYLHIAKPRRGMLPADGRQLGFIAGRIHELGLYPVGPIAAMAVAAVGHHKVQFLGALEIGGERGFRIGLGEDLRRHDRFRALTSELAAGFGARIAARLGLATLVVEISVQILLGQLAGHTGRRHLRLGHPYDGVEYGLAIIVVAPVQVIMATGKAEAAAAIRAFKGPGHMLRIAGCHALAHMGIAAVSAITALHGFGRGHIRQDRRHSLHILGKPHVEVPLIISLKRFHPTGDRVLGQFLEVSNPVRVHRPMRLETAALPGGEFLVALSGGGLHGVMDGEETGALVHQLAKQLKVVALQRGMAAAAIAVNHHGIRAFKDTAILGKPVGDHGGLHEISSAFLEAFGQQHDAGAVFVGERPVALRAGNHHHLLGRSQRAQSEAQSQGEC